MIYNENKEPLFIHFYLNSLVDRTSCVSDSDASAVYNAVAEGIPVIGVFHVTFDDNSVHIYEAQEAYNIIDGGGDLETPCIVKYAEEGQYIPIFEVEAGMTFGFLELLSTWMGDTNNFDVELRAKLYSNLPYNDYTFSYNKVMEGSDELTFMSPSYEFSIKNGPEHPILLGFNANTSSDIYIMPAFTTSKCELEPGVYTYYAVFQTYSSDNAITIQMKNDMVRFANGVDDDMTDWDYSNDDSNIVTN